MNGQEIHRRVLVNLKSMRNHLGNIGAIPERNVVEYHTELQRLQEIGDDVAEFYVQQSDVKPDITSQNIRTGEIFYSSEKYVKAVLMLPKLEGVIAYLESFGSAKETDAIQAIEQISRCFHLIVRQLRVRHDSRPTLDVKDEYDVQDLLHALLKLYFDDIRAEEWAPSYAGSSARMDFLIKNQNLVVETKIASDNLRDRKIGEQLIVDIARYSEHPNCRTLVCFVYNPEGYISNPAGLESDLQKLSSEKLNVQVFIFPKQ